MIQTLIIQDLIVALDVQGYSDTGLCVEHRLWIMDLLTPFMLWKKAVDETKVAWKWMKTQPVFSFTERE